MAHSSAHRLWTAALSVIALTLTASSPSWASDSSSTDGDAAVQSQQEEFTTVLSPDEKDAMMAEFSSHGVKHEVAHRLIDALEHGQMWDSMRPGALPVSTSRTERGTNIEVVNTYEDGSIAISTTSNLEAAKEAAAPTSNEAQNASVYGCRFSSGGSYAGYWRDCVADVNLISVRMGFTSTTRTSEAEEAKSHTTGPISTTFSVAR